jgi:glutamate dehydrogenase/leucine dehydrogenase
MAASLRDNLKLEFEQEAIRLGAVTNGEYDASKLTTGIRNQIDPSLRVDFYGTSGSGHLGNVQAHHAIPRAELLFVIDDITRIIHVADGFAVSRA